jgi:TonB family protein
MASPEKIAPLLPDTLPDDFGEWDNEGSAKDEPAYGWESQAAPAATIYSWETQAPVATPEPVRANEWEEWEATHSSKASRLPLQPAERRAVLSPVVDKPQASDAASSARASLEQQAVDSDASATAKQDEADEWAVWAAAHSSRKNLKPLVKPTEFKAASSPVVEKPRVSDSAPSASTVAKPQEPVKEPAGAPSSRASAKAETSHAAHAATATPSRPNFAVADEALYQMFSSATFEEKDEEKSAGKKRITIIAASAGSVLVLVTIMIAMFHHGTTPATKQSVQPLPAVTITEAQQETPKPRPGEPLVQGNAPATTATQPATDSQSTNDDNQADSTTAPTQTQTQMMNDQLAAPTRIQRDANKQVAENEPSGAGFGITGVDGLGSSAANGAIFNGHTQSVVKAQPPKPVAISSGVATGMLISKMPPVYPPIAKTARVSGTVALQATISKIGTITDLRVVSGPAMLRQAAVDAVRTWRYRPYKLNNEPTEVETTINVVFSLGD